MPRWTIRRMMLVIAGAAAFLWVYVGIQSRSLCRFECTPAMQCASREKNVVLGLLAYASRTGSFPRGTWPNAGLKPDERLSWYFATLAYNDLDDLAQHVDPEAAWCGDPNLRVASQRIGWFNCPGASRRGIGSGVATPYVGIAGVGADAPFLPSGHPPPVSSDTIVRLH